MITAVRKVIITDGATELGAYYSHRYTITARAWFSGQPGTGLEDDALELGTWDIRHGGQTRTEAEAAATKAIRTFHRRYATKASRETVAEDFREGRKTPKAELAEQEKDEARVVGPARDLGGGG